MESIEDSKKSGKALGLKPGIDDSNLKDLAFNDHHWEENTRTYIISVKTLSETSFNQICDWARQSSKSTWKVERSGSPSVGDQKPLDWRALLI